MPLPFEGRGPARVVDFLRKAVYTWIVLNGEYDYVAIGEAPSDEVATTFSLALGSGGNVKERTS